MYGMVHKAARAYTIESFGEAFWESFAHQNALTEATFIMGQNYSDEVTFGLIGGLAVAMETPPEDLLRKLGRYWIEFASAGPCCHLMSMGGDTLPAFITNLDRMHAGLAAAMPGSKMPLFYLLEDTPRFLSLRYVSRRAGLEPFVVGLFEGLCAMFAIAADVSRREGADACIFDIRYRMSVVA